LIWLPVILKIRKALTPSPSPAGEGNKKIIKSCSASPCGLRCTHKLSAISLVTNDPSIPLKKGEEENSLFKGGWGVRVSLTSTEGVLLHFKKIAPQV
jgi:hypothetical protein